MSWFAGDDRFPTHRKVMRLRRQEHFAEAIALWALCGMWAAGDEQARDTGVVPLDVVACQGVTEWRSAHDALVLVGLWDLDPDDPEVVRFHDWDDWNGPGAKTKRIEKRLEADRVRQQNRRQRLSRDPSRDMSRDSPQVSRDGHVNSGYGNGKVLVSPSLGESSSSSSETADAVTDKPKPPREQPPRPDKNDRPDIHGLCNLLADLMVENGCNRPPITKKWLDEARLLIDKDKRDPTKAEALLRWSQQDPFWRSNIQSIPTFRGQYEKLRLKANDEWTSTRTGQRGTSVPVPGQTLWDREINHA